MRYKIKQLPISGVLNQAITLMQNHFGLLLQIMLIAWIPYNVIGGLINLSIIPDVPDNPTPDDMQRVMQSLVTNLPTLLAIAFIGLFIILPITNAAMIHAVAELYLGKQITAFGAMQKGLSRLGPLILTWILWTLAVWGGFLLCIAPGILFALWFGLCQHVCVLEGQSGPTAMSRSKELVQKYLGEFLLLGMIVAGITFAITMGSAMIPQKHLQLLVNQVVGAVMTIFSTTVFVVFYFSCRCGHENFDLEILAAAVGESVSPQELDSDGVEVAEPDDQ